MPDDKKVHFRCHSCDKPLAVDLQHAGKWGKCPACAQRVRVPVRPEPAAAIEALPEKPALEAMEDTLQKALGLLTAGKADLAVSTLVAGLAQHESAVENADRGTQVDLLQRRVRVRLQLILRLAPPDKIDWRETYWKAAGLWGTSASQFHDILMRYQAGRIPHSNCLPLSDDKYEKLKAEERAYFERIDEIAKLLKAADADVRRAAGIDPERGSLVADQFAITERAKQFEISL